jgi:hypothetical protein
LVHIQGESVNKRVKHIRFEGITFSYDHWNLLDVAGSHGFAGFKVWGLAVKYIPGGNWHPSEYNTTDVPRGAIQVENAEYIEFIRNRFEGISSAIAINMVNDVKNSRVEGNYFNDLLGNAVSVGYPQHYKIGNEEVKPAEKGTSLSLADQPVDKAKIQTYKAGIEGLCENIRVANNYIRNISLDFRQVEAITSFLLQTPASTTTILKERLTGQSPVAGGGNSGIRLRKLPKQQHHLTGRGIPIRCSMTEELSIYWESSRAQKSKATIVQWATVIYPDDGSAYLSITRNVINNNSYKWMWLHLWTSRCHDIAARDNYVINNLLMDNGTNNTIEKTHSFRDKAEFSGEALKIIAKAGIEEKYRDIVPKEEPVKLSIYPENFKERDVFS